MKKIVIILAVTVAIIGTYAFASSQNKPSRDSVFLQTEVHDSCEYVVYKWVNAGGVTHKTNCKYCKARDLK